MAEYTSTKKNSSNIAKWALGLGTVGAANAIGVFGNNNSSGSGILPNLFGGNSKPVYVAPGAFSADSMCGGFVSEKELKYVRENAAKDNTIVKLEAASYADKRIAESLAPVYSELSKQKDDICDLKAALALESERRACGDERLDVYIRSNYIPAEKSINSRDINFHGVRPVIEPTCGRECA